MPASTATHGTVSFETAQLGQGRSSRSLARDTPLVTEGPFAESVEQLSGFYIVTCDDYDALVQAAQVLTRSHPVVEIRPVAEF